MTDKQQTVIVLDGERLMRLADAFRIQNDQLNEKDRTITELRETITSLRSDIEHHECGPDGR